MIWRAAALAVATMTGSVHALQSGVAIPLYLAEPASSVSAQEYAIDIEGTTVAAATLTRGPQPLAAIVLIDRSDSVRPVPLDAITKRIAGWVHAGDTVRVATFADRIVIGPTPIVDRPSATRAAREVGQTGGASPLWDAICTSVDALRHLSGLKAVIILSDGQANANDRGFSETADFTTPSGVVISVAGVADTALPFPGQMQVIGRNDGLRQLARDTGGRYAEVKSLRDDPITVVISSLNDLRGRARIDFVPPMADGLVHRISVTLRGRPVQAPLQLKF